jgi:hypothetical protein
VAQHVNFGDPSESNVACHIDIQFEQKWFWMVLHGPTKLEDLVYWFFKFSDLSDISCQV